MRDGVYDTNEVADDDASALPADDVGRCALVRERLSTSVIGDVLDQLGLTHQVLPQGIVSVRPDAVLAGRAMPVLVSDVFSAKQPYGRLAQAVDALEPGEVYLARGGRLDCAAWGEIPTAAAIARGAAGAVIDGFHRDTARVVDRRWPVFSRGACATDAGIRTQVVDYRVPIEIGAVRIRPGDLVVGDADGVVAIPNYVEDDVLERALARAEARQEMLRAVARGVSVAEAFSTHGVL